MIYINELRSFAKTAHYGHIPLEVSGSVMLELLDRLEAAEKERDWAELMSLALRARVAKMERQEPYCTAIGPGDWTYQISSPARPGMALYAIPGA